MILAVKAVENLGISPTPSWYDEVRKWADASSTAFLYYNTVEQGSYRIVKLGSCWGGFGGDGHNPSYASPGAFKIMRDYQKDFPSSDRSYSIPPAIADLEGEWNKLIDSTYEAYSVFQCPDYGVFPNWGRIQIDGATGQLEVQAGGFSGSGTPQNEFGSEASRTIWRAALDGALYPHEVQVDVVPFMSPLLTKMEDGYNGNPSLYFDSSTVSDYSAMQRFVL